MEKFRPKITVKQRLNWRIIFWGFFLQVFAHHQQVLVYLMTREGGY